MAKSTSLLFILGLVQIFSSTITTTTCNGKTLPRKFPAILIFGDSTVDTGNNNYILRAFKGNHRPYGNDFPGHIPTGRFSNGKLVPDFLASMLGLKDTVPPYLQPNISDRELLTGVSFASGGSGFDVLTTAVSGAISMSRQREYLREYIERLIKVVGEKEAQKIVAGALVIVSAGTNDFVFNFYDIPTRRLQFSVSDYQDFLQNKLQDFVKELYDLGCRKILVSGLPPVGCLPIQLTVKLSILRRCVDKENLDSQSYNDKLQKLLPKMQETFPGTKILYVDTYTHLMDMIKNPQKYGFVETTRGCCGTGILEAGPLCNEGTPICPNPSQYIFFDSIHPAELTYRYLSEQLAKELLPYLSQTDNSC